MFQLNDFPDFLQGEERENTQHVLVKYLTDKPQKGRKTSRKDTLSKDATSRSATSSPSRTNTSRQLSARNSIAVDRLVYSAREPMDRKQSLNSLTSRSLPEKRVQFDRVKDDVKFGPYLTVPGNGSKDLNQNRNTPDILKTESPRLIKKDKIRTNSLDPNALKKVLQNAGENGLFEQNRKGKKSERPLPTPRRGSEEGNKNASNLNTGKLYEELKMSLENELEEGSDEDEDEMTLVVPSVTVPPLDLKRTSSEGEEDDK